MCEGEQIRLLVKETFFCFSSGRTLCFDATRRTRKLRVANANQPKSMEGFRTFCTLFNSAVSHWSI